jgi:hypothetical protein
MCLLDNRHYYNADRQKGQRGNRPAPTAGAMVARVRQLPIGVDLAALDATLQGLRLLAWPTASGV